MCGRFVSIAKKNKIKKIFNVKKENNFSEESYNISPSKKINVLYYKDGELILDSLKWGYSFFSKFNEKNQLVINSRLETINSKLIFKDSYLKRKCIIIANGYFEWKRVNEKKQPYFINIPEQELFYFAGIWRSEDFNDKKQTVWKNVPEEELFHPNPDYKMEPSYQKYRMSVLQGKIPNIFDKYTQEDNPYLQFARLVVVDPVRKIEEQYFDEKKITLTSQNQMEREIFKAIEKKITANPDFRRNVDSRANYLQQLGIPFDKQRAVKELGQHVYDEIPAKTAMLHVLYDKERIKYDYELLREKINKNPKYESTLTKDELQLLEEGKRIDELYDQYQQKAFLEQHKTAVKMLPQGATASEIERKAEQLLNAPLKSESNMLMYVGIGVAALGIGFLYLKR